MSNISDISEWLFIDEGNGDKYNLCQSNYFDGGLYTEDGLYRYKWTGTEAVLRTEEEIAGEHNVSPAPVPTQLDSIEAQVTYTVMMTDTLLEV